MIIKNRIPILDLCDLEFPRETSLNYLQTVKTMIRHRFI